MALAALVAIVAWLATQSGNEPSSGSAPGPRIVDRAGLADAAARSGHPVYWIGSLPGTELELSESGAGNVQVRYLTIGAEAGSEPEALTVGSYPLPDPAAAIATFAARPGSVTRRSLGGREVVFNRERPTSAYFASPGNAVQVEVYDRSPKRALALALSPRVRPAG